MTAIFALVSLAMIAAGAGCWRSHRRASDAGVDARLVDAGVDALSEDARRVDAGVDSSGDGFVPGGWRSVAGFDPLCDVRVAEAPTAVVPSLEEEPCAGIDGCRELRFPAELAPDVAVTGGAPEVRWDATHARGHFWWRAQVDSQPDWFLALVDSNGVTRQVVSARRANDCYVVAAGAGGGRFGVAIDVLDRRHDEAMGSGDIDDPTSLVHDFQIDFPAATVQYLMVEGRTSVPSFSPDWVWRRDEGLTIIRRLARDMVGRSDDVFGDVVFVTDASARPMFIGMLSAGGDVAPFIAPRDGSNAFGFRTDGVNMVWRQGYGVSASPHDRVEIWTAPLTTSSADVGGRRIADAPIREEYIGHDFYGNAVVDSDVDGSYLVHFLDGAPSRRLRSPDGQRMSLLYAGPEEVAMRIGEYVGVERVRFFRYDALPVAD